MQDDAIRTARIHPDVHPGNRDEVHMAKFPARLSRSQEWSQPALSLVCYTAVFSGEERCMTTLKTAV